MKNLLNKYPLQSALSITLLSVFIFEFIGIFNISSITNNSSEFNVIAMAADLGGYDWKTTILKTHYYGYPASFIFSLIFLIKPIVANPELLLHSLLLVNIIINVICAAILFFFILNLLKCNRWKINYFYIALITIACSLLISNQVLTKTVTNENIFILFYYIAIYIITFGNKNPCSKNQIINSLILALVGILAYANNGRGIILISITIIMFISYKILKMMPFGKMWIYAIALAVLFLISQFAKDYFVTTYYYVPTDISTGLKNADVGGVIERAIQLLNFKGVKLFVKLLIGWGTYFIVSTYGWGVFAIAASIRCICDKVVHKKKVSDADVSLAAIVLLFLIGISILGICFYHDSFYAMSYDSSSSLADGRVDKLIYGRYISTIKSIALAYGFVNTIYRYDNNKLFCISFAIIIVLEMLFYSEIIPLMLGRRYAAVDIPEFALYFKNFEVNYKFGSINSLDSFKLLFSSILIAFLIMFLLSKMQKSLLAITVVLMLNVVVGIKYTNELMIPRSQYYKNLINQDYTEYIRENFAEDSLIVVDKNTYLYQFFLPTFKVIMSDSLEDEPLEQYENVIFLEFSEAVLINFQSIAVDCSNSVIISNAGLINEIFVLEKKYYDFYEYTFAD